MMMLLLPVPFLFVSLVKVMFQHVYIFIFDGKEQQTLGHADAAFQCQQLHVTQFFVQVYGRLPADKVVIMLLLLLRQLLVAFATTDSWTRSMVPRR